MTIEFKDLLQVELRPDVAYVLEVSQHLSQDHIERLQESWRIHTSRGDANNSPKLIVLPPGFRLAKSRTVEVEASASKRKVLLGAERAYDSNTSLLMERRF